MGAWMMRQFSNTGSLDVQLPSGGAGRGAAAATAPTSRSRPAQEPDEDAADFVPDRRNYLVFCDESGIHGATFHGFGSFWLPYDRRGDFAALLAELRGRHRYRDEIKWKHVKASNAAFYEELVEEFFRRNWLMFHCLVIKREDIDWSRHKNRDEALQKHFTMLLTNKIAFFSRTGRDKVYHVRVDPIPVRYPKAAEVVEKLAAARLRKALDVRALQTLYVRDSKKTPGIQMADLLLGAVVAARNREDRTDAKESLRTWIAKHLGWPDLCADTRQQEWKFNIWRFYDPTRGPRDERTRDVRLLYPMPRAGRR